MIPAQTCRAEILLPRSYFPLTANTSLSYFEVPDVGFPIAITSSLVVNYTMTMAQIQSLLDNDPTRIASGYTIRVISFDSVGLKARISIPSSVQVDQDVRGLVSDNTPVSSSFTCNLEVSNSGGGGNWAISPESTTCSRAEWDELGCPDIMIVDGVEYKFQHEQDGECCFNKVMPFYRYFDNS